ncbi:unnamed protein product [Notodromas monacha]|uniref:SEA domain-containing protein n=1 Tax=Notodromas monacha TaxID=399045 RepID=A0A7R9GF04_9CRUS|nr:unnamed protein product [Notodromas monacha]CAG0918370.1 unnamed protein product [Notodromas monacha]
MMAGGGLVTTHISVNFLLVVFLAGLVGAQLQGESDTQVYFPPLYLRIEEEVTLHKKAAVFQRNFLKEIYFGSTVFGANAVFNPFVINDAVVFDAQESVEAVPLIMPGHGDLLPSEELLSSLERLGRANRFSVGGSNRGGGGGGGGSSGAGSGGPVQPAGNRLQQAEEQRRTDWRLPSVAQVAVTRGSRFPAKRRPAIATIQRNLGSQQNPITSRFAPVGAGSAAPSSIRQPPSEPEPSSRFPQSVQPPAPNPKSSSSSSSLETPAISSSTSGFSQSAGYVNLEELYAHVMAVRHHAEDLGVGVGVVDVDVENEPVFQSRGPAPIGVTVDGASSPSDVEEDVGQTNSHLGNRRRRPGSVIRRLITSSTEVPSQSQQGSQAGDPLQPTTIPSNVEVSVVDIPLSTDIPFTKILADKIREETEKVRLKNLQKLALESSSSSAVPPETSSEPGILILSSVQTSKSVSSDDTDTTTTATTTTTISALPATSTTERTKWTPPKPLPPRKPNSGVLSPLLFKNKKESEDVEQTTQFVKSIPDDLVHILANFKQEDLSKILPPGVKLISVTTPEPPTTVAPSSSTTSYPVVSRKNKKLPAHLGKDDEPGLKVSDVLGSLFPGGGGGKGDQRKKLPQKSVGDLFDEIDFGSAVGVDPGLLPKDFSSTTPRTTSSTTATTTTTSSAKPVLVNPVSLTDVKNLLPPGFKLEDSTESFGIQKQLEVLLKSLQNSNNQNASVLPTTQTTTTVISTTSTAATPAIPGLVFKDVLDTSFLPPGFEIKPEVVSPNLAGLLPPGYVESLSSSTTSEKTTISTAGTTKSTTSATTSVQTTEATTKPFLIFPGGSRTRKPIADASSPAPVFNFKPLDVTFGFPKRVTTEFTGWPTSSTEATKFDQPASNEGPSDSSSSSSTSSSTTSTTTTTTQRPTTTSFRTTTPGVCGSECRLGATIRIVGGADWSPALWDKNSYAYKDMAKKLEEEACLDAVYRNSLLSDWYDRVEIEAFSPGSVVVDYVVWLRGLENREVDTGQLKKLFYKSVDALSTSPSSNDRRNRQKSLKPSAIPDRLTLGSYTLDPFYTDFIGSVERELGDPLVLTPADA